MLSEFEVEGFRIIENAILPEECDAILVALKEVPMGRAGARHLLRFRPVGLLASDPRIKKVVEKSFGKPVLPFRATLFAKTGKANWLVVWHQDTALPLKNRFEAPGWGPWSRKDGIFYAHAPAWALSRTIAARIHLDDSTPENGPLRVIPGSHTSEVFSDEEIERRVKASAATECLVNKGGLLLMSPLIIHSSSKALRDSPRRVLHIEYAESMTLAPSIELSTT